MSPDYRGRFYQIDCDIRGAAMTPTLSPLRIAVLGAAPVAVYALVRPSRRVPETQVVAVAARDGQRARRFATRHAIPRVHRTYHDVLADPNVDAVYLPLPNSLHARWAIAALRCGKHVLCEKPLASNEEQAVAMKHAAAGSGRLLVEAFHYRYHPLAARLKAIVAGGELGTVRHIDIEFSVPLLDLGSAQFRYELGGGAVMDCGCYAINLLRMLAGTEPEVVGARARTLGKQVDRLMRAWFRLAGGASATITCALLSARGLRLQATVYGSTGRLRVDFPFLPHIWHRVTISTAAGTRRERLAGDTTYVYQLRAFAAAVRDKQPPLTSADDAVLNMHIIDAVYRAAGLRLRPGAPIEE